ncbi:MAG: diguanylate cyclase [Solobacterium sp.]|nr:diguanylate cyclase [Solobacterium sp.]
MELNKFILSILHFFRLDRKSEFVQEWIDRTNMHTAVPVSIYTLFMERVLYNRTVLLWGLIPKVVYNYCFIALAVCSIQLLAVSLLYLTGKLKSHKIVCVSLYIFFFGCVVLGQIISIYDYAIGKQMIVLIPIVAWIFALMLANPVSTSLMAITAFLIIPVYANKRIIMSGYAKEILNFMAIMMEVIAIVRWITQIRAAESEEKLNQMNQRLSDISMKDELTGLKNRYGLRKDFDQLKGKEAALLMADIDDFKYYNDTYGHDTGDDVLCHMAKTLTQTFGADAVYRFGGDEFLLILPGWDEAKILSAIHEWHSRFRVFHYQEKILHLGSTAGFAIGTIRNENDLSQMISLADSKLYEGKMSKKGSITGAYYSPEEKSDQSDVKKLENNLRSGEMDTLTNLPNMMYFRSRADLTADILRSSGKRPVLAYFNFAGFKDYNRKHGFEAGDRLLKRMAVILSKEFRDDLVCRLADDHFTLIAPKNGIVEKIESVAVKLNETAGDARIAVRAGLYELRDGSVDVSLACDCARQALIGSRRTETCSWYDDEMRKKLEQKQYISDHLDEVLEKGYIENLYQPVFRSVNHFVCGVEVLPRWNDPKYGVLEPETYVPVLESTRQILEHDMHVLKNAVEAFRNYQDRGLPVMPIVINLSSRDFEEEAIVTRINELTKEMDHSLIHFDIMASAFRHTNSRFTQVLEELKQEGYQIWMDGFCRDHSTVDVLYQGLIHGIKIDIRSMRNQNDVYSRRVFLAHVIGMVKELNIASLALGVESEHEAQFLAESGCEYMQGFWLSENLSFEEISSQAFLTAHQIELHADEPYYAAMSKVNLAKPARLHYDRTLDTVSDELPAAICEMRDGTLHTMLSNAPFRNFLHSRDISSISRFDTVMNDQSYPVSIRLREVCEQLLQSNQWETAEIGLGKKSCTCSFHLISRNEAEHAYSVIGVVVNMKLYQSFR